MDLRNFKIGEYAVGGIIKVRVNIASVFIQALDYETKVPVVSSSFKNEPSSYWQVMDRLHELTTAYYAEKIMKFIEENSNIENLGL